MPLIRNASDPRPEAFRPVDENELLASVLAYQAAMASFPLGTTLGGVWYTVFPVAASPGLIVSVTGTVMAAGAVIAAFSGIIADPLQRRLGLHRRRLLRLIDALERRFSGDGEAGFVVRDHYVARLLTLLELLSSAYRLETVGARRSPVIRELKPRPPAGSAITAGRR